MTANVNADSTFEGLWRRIRVYAPECPLPLAQEFINTAYSRILSRQAWTGVRGQTEISVDTLYDTGTVNVTQGSATVQGTLTSFTSAMIGRQFFLSPGVTGSNAPFYTIIAVPNGTTLTLDRPWGLPTATTQAYNILTVYLTMPSDFLNLETVVDIQNNWKLHLNFQQANLDVWDAKRSVTGTSWVLAPATTSPVVSTFGQLRYEIWPRTAPGPKTFPIRYIRKPALLVNPTDTPVFPIRGDLIREGALAELALWPGTSEYKNPYHDLNLHRTHLQLFEKYLGETIREESEINQAVVFYEDYEGLPYAPIDAKFLQTHDIF